MIRVMTRTARRDNGRESEHHPESGSITVFLVVLTLALFALVGLVVDGGRAVAARSAAAGEAEQAARLGAGQLSLDAIRSGTISIDPVGAVRAAQSYLRAAGTVGTVTATAQIVVVHIQSSEPTVILGIVGVDNIQISMTASASNVHGVTRSDS
jgi:Flp pilus assembly protein TadG